MKLLYNLGIRVSALGIKIASLWNHKAKLWVNGRKNFSIPEGLDGCIWFHCASLGEFEQAKPVIHAIKTKHPNHTLVVSFYSPSGFEQRKNFELADWVFYLPVDTKSNAKKLVTSLKPSMVFFVKYELWHHHLKAIKDTGSKLFLLSATFRPKHRYFKWYGSFFRDMLLQMDMIFVQDDRSMELLNSIGISNKMKTGDTRYDQVSELPKTEFKDEIIEDFCRITQKTLIVGSSWPKEEAIINKAIVSLSDEWRIILAPHDVSAAHIREIESKFGNDIVKHSTYESASNKLSAKVLLIDSVGILSRIYRYGDAAFIGGGYTGNLHNILEPASYGIPVCFGPNHSKFPEAGDILQNGDAAEISSSDDLLLFLNNIATSKTDDNSKFIEARSGAADKVMQYLMK